MPRNGRENGSDASGRPGASARVVAPAFIGAAILLGVVTFFLLAFLQVFAAIFTGALTAVCAMYGAAALAGGKEAPDKTHSDDATVVHLERWTRLTSGLLGAVFVYGGIIQLFGVQWVVDRYAMWTYPDALRWTVGAVELIAGVALLIPRIATIGAVLLVPIMLGATYTFLFRGTGAMAALPMVLVALLAFVGWEQSRARTRWLEHYSH